MRALCDMDTIQIELTNSCLNRCSNCTRFVGHQKPFYLSQEQFSQALRSMIGYPKMIGFMGGEPLLHPLFESFCKEAREIFQKEQLGLWTCLPKGYELYADVICETFGHIFINDHTRGDILHAPILVGIEEVFSHPGEMYYAIDHCWVQNFWSASINPKGAFFCEIAASMSLLFDGPEGWAVEPGWWWRTPKDFKEQIEEYCPKCGCSIPLPRRQSIDGRDDISPENLKRLQNKSFKVNSKKYVLSDLRLTPEPGVMGAYKDQMYRSRVAERYGIFLEPNALGFLSPYRKIPFQAAEKSLFCQLTKEMEG